MSALPRRGVTGFLVILVVMVAVVVLVRRAESPVADEAGPDTPPTSESTTLEPSTPSDTDASPAEEEPPLTLDPARTLPSEQRLADAGCDDPIRVAPPAADLAAQVAAADPGACFVLDPGEYRFRDVTPKDYMTFVGTGPDEVIVRGDENTENAFNGTAHAVTIARMAFVGFQGDAGEKRQEQAPIRGTAAIWLSDRGEMATDWLIEDVASTDNYASGLLLGDFFTVRDSRFEGNGVTGISGSEVTGGLIEHNLVTGNGGEQLTGFEVNGGGMKFGETGLPDAPLVIRSNEVRGNVGIGIWCDIGCRGFEVLDNYIHDHSSRAVMYELSVGAVIRGNTIVDSNSWSDFLRDFNAGAITVGESADVLVEDNYIEGSVSAITIRQTLRPVRPQENFLDNYEFINVEVSDVTVRNNVVVDAEETGISIGTTGRGLITDLASIVFEGNSYDDPDRMRFWSSDGAALSFADWQASGRDREALGTISPDPSPWRGSGGEEALLTEAVPIVTPVFINAGGGEYSSAGGQVWQADQFFVGGDVAQHEVDDVIGTDEDALFTQERWGLDGYQLPVENGSYLVRLFHAEVFEGCQVAGCRIFTITVEGEVVADQLDIFATVGGRTTLELEHVAEVSDGVLNIDFEASLQEPQISAIAVEAVTAS